MANGKQSLALAVWAVLGGVAAAALPSCKTIAPEVVEGAAREGGWYSYIPERAPGFCLRTRLAIVWHDPHMHLGYWQGLHTDPPYRVMMEARDSTFVLHRHYVWDGNSIGHTSEADLLPSLRHDALYHALKEGAPISRKEIDFAYRRDQKKTGGGCNLLAFYTLRLFGGLYNQRGADEEPTLIIRPTTPDTPPAPLESDKVEEDPLRNLLPKK